MIIFILLDDTVSFWPAAQDKFFSWQYDSEKTQYLTSESPKKSICLDWCIYTSRQVIILSWLITQLVGQRYEFMEAHGTD